MDEMTDEINSVSVQTRVRMNCSLTAKGFVQWEITSEFPSTDEANANLKEGITKLRETLKALGLQEAHA